MYQFIYVNKTTGEKVYSNKELHDKNLRNIFAVRKTVIDKPVRIKTK